MAIRRNVTNEAFYEKLAHTDALTALYNRASIENFATTFIGESKRDGCPFSTIMIDLDNFKEVNDTFGHQAGDLVLKKVAQIAITLMRSNDRMGRFGVASFEEDDTFFSLITKADKALYRAKEMGKNQVC